MEADKPNPGWLNEAICDLKQEMEGQVINRGRTRIPRERPARSRRRRPSSDPVRRLSTLSITLVCSLPSGRGGGLPASRTLKDMRVKKPWQTG